MTSIFDAKFNMTRPAHLLSYIGAHYSLCPVEIRELWTQTFDSTEGRRKLKEIAFSRLGQDCLEIVPIFTCNRFDICIYGRPAEEALLVLFSELSIFALRKASQLDSSITEVLSSEEKLRKVLRIKQGEEAVLQLFRVACSLDSLVLGEPHILGQLKEQYFVARDLRLSGPRLESFFARSFAVAKRVRTDTDLGRSGVSIGHAAVLLVSRIFDDMSQRSALIIGCGEMGRLSSQHLISQKIGHLSLANRTESRARALAHELGTGASLTLEQAIEDICSFDIVIVATSSRETLLEKKHFAAFNRTRKGSPAVLVDISVPRNVDASCSEVSENLFVFDVDDLDKVMDKNRELRKESAQIAERLIFEELSHFTRAQIQRDNLHQVGQFHQLVRRYTLLELKKGLRKRGNHPELHPLTTERIEVIADAVAKKLVSLPAEIARQGEPIPEGSVGEILDALFNLKQLQVIDSKEETKSETRDHKK